MSHRPGHPKNQTIFRKSPSGFALLKYRKRLAMSLSTLSQLRLRSGYFFVGANSWKGSVTNVLAAIPLKLISQIKIASCDVLPLGPDLRVTLQLRFGAKHRGQPSAFGSGSHAISSTNIPSRVANRATGQLVPSQAITARF
jgi:hypothetical protein